MSPTRMIKSHEKKCQNYFHVDYDQVKSLWNVDFEEKDTERLTEKNDAFCLLWGISKEHIKNIILAVLRNANPHSVIIWRLIKLINNIKEDTRKKTYSNFGF